MKKNATSLPRKIAFIDDDVDLLESYLAILQERYEVHIFSDAFTFLEAVSKDRDQFDLILTDFSMPKMNGLEMLKKFHELGAMTPSVVFSGHLSKETCLELNKYRAFRLIEKPTSLAHLLEAMEETLKIHHRLIKIKRLKDALIRMEDLFRASQILSETFIDENHHLSKSFSQLDEVVKELIKDIESLELDEAQPSVQKVS